MMVLMKRLSTTNRGMYVDRLWITDPGKIPTKYFLRPNVMAAIRKEILHDVRSGQLKRVPGGCQVRLVRKSFLRHILDLLRGRK
jgi:hypothetical protein